MQAMHTFSSGLKALPWEQKEVRPNFYMSTRSLLYYVEIISDIFWQFTFDQSFDLMQ